MYWNSLLHVRTVCNLVAVCVRRICVLKLPYVPVGGRCLHRARTRAPAVAAADVPRLVPGRRIVDINDRSDHPAFAEQESNQTKSGLLEHLAKGDLR